MPNNYDPHMQIARKIQSIEIMKVDLLQQVTEVYKGILSGNQRQANRDLAGLVGVAYLLALQLGQTPVELDAMVAQSMPRTLQRDDIDFTDLDMVRKHFSAKR